MRELTYAEALRECLRQTMAADESVFMIGEDVGVYGGAFGVSAGLLTEFGEERIIDTPISEAGLAGACIGAALTGMRPVGEIQFMDFVSLSMEQIVLQAAKIRFMFGGEGYSTDGLTNAGRFWCRCCCPTFVKFGELVCPCSRSQSRHAQ